MGLHAKLKIDYFEAKIASYLKDLEIIQKILYQSSGLYFDSPRVCADHQDKFGNADEQRNKEFQKYDCYASFHRYSDDFP
jgi:hypothetical protein